MSTEYTTKTFRLPVIMVDRMAQAAEAAGQSLPDWLRATLANVLNKEAEENRVHSKLDAVLAEFPKLQTAVLQKLADLVAE